MIDKSHIPSKGKIAMPFDGSQMNFCASNVDIAFYAGGVGCGKSRMLALVGAEGLLTDSSFRMIIFRRSLQNQKAGGGLADEFEDVYGEYCDVKISDSPRIRFANGAYCDLTYFDDTDLDKLRERSKGWQYDLLCGDELTEMPWGVWTYVNSRNRGKSKVWTGKSRWTYNPKRSHWTRIFVDWYIGIDGTIREDRNGAVRYFYIPGETPESVIWGDSKEEVYSLCKIDIDRKLKAMGEGFTYEHLIKSFALFVGKLSENKALVNNNAAYIGSVAMSGGKLSQQLLEVNFNVDPDEEEDVPMPSAKVRDCFVNNPARNGDKWITVDLTADGSDNMVALSWDGFHAFDKLVLNGLTPRGYATRLREFASKHNIGTSHIIFDAINGSWMKDYIPDAKPFKSSHKAIGLYKDSAMTLKDLCYLRLVKMVNEGMLTFDEDLAQSMYYHKGLDPVSMQNEIMEEFAVVRFDEQQSGKKRLWAKKKMNAMLGKGRSMDVADPCAMRMYPCINMEYGDEISHGSVKSVNKEQVYDNAISVNIYDETNWS